MEKHIEYAVLIERQLKQMFLEESENHISIDDLSNSEDNVKAFFHALASLVPASMFSMFVEDKNVLEFNHIANSLCFEFVKYREKK